MSENELAGLEIIDIFKIKRSNPKSITTTNKFCHVLSCRTQGECTFIGKDVTLTAKRGDVLFIPATSDYTQHHTKENVICFHLALARQGEGYTMQLFTPQDPDAICALFKKAEHIWSGKGKNYKIFCLAILYEIIALTGAMLKKEEPPLPPALHTGMEYLHTHLYDTDFSLKNAISAGGVSRTYFNRLFREAFDTTPTQYVNTLRINRAKQLLKAGSYTNEEIARACGFNETEYFYAVFKKLTGMTAKEYKRT